MTDVNMRRLKDAPADQDVDAIAKATKDKIMCDVCGEREGDIWMHCDSWTKWMRFGCGCNVHYCGDECKEGAEAIKREKLAENGNRAKEAEKKALEDPNAGQLARIRARYLDAFNCSQEFRDWVESVVGEEKMHEYLDIPCECCGQQLGEIRYFFEDPDGNQSLKPMDEIEIYCREKLGLAEEDPPFTIKSECYTDKNKEAEIMLAGPVWDYYERKGWEHGLKYYGDDAVEGEKARHDEAWDATKDKACGGSCEWMHATFIWHLPTKTYLGKWRKAGGDWPQIVQTNREELDAERKQICEKYGENPDWGKEYRAVDEKQKWAYFCCKECANKSTGQQGTIFI